MGDWNEDGDLDAMVTLGGADVYRLLGDGDCTFSGIVSADIGVGGLSVLETADLDLDGHLDVLAKGSTEIALLLGSGSGNFAPPVELGVGGSIHDIAVGDFNADGTPDIVAGSSFDVFLLESNP